MKLYPRRWCEKTLREYESEHCRACSIFFEQVPDSRKAILDILMNKEHNKWYLFKKIIKRVEQNLEFICMASEMDERDGEKGIECKQRVRHYVENIAATVINEYKPDKIDLYGAYGEHHGLA